MKTLMTIVLTTMMSLSAYAYDVPKDAVIKVYNKNGKQIGHMSRAKYKVVLIEEHAPCTPVANVEPQPKPEEPKAVVEKKSYENEVIAHGGFGYTGITTTYTKGSFSVSEDSGFVGGLTYCRSNGSLGLCGSVFTNKTTLLGVKFGF